MAFRLTASPCSSATASSHVDRCFSGSPAARSFSRLIDSFNSKGSRTRNLRVGVGAVFVEFQSSALRLFTVYFISYCTCPCKNSRNLSYSFLSDNSISGRTLLVPERLCASRQRPQTALSRCRELYASRLLGFYPLSPGWFGAPLVLRGYPVITAGERPTDVDSIL